MPDVKLQPSEPFVEVIEPSGPGVPCRQHVGCSLAMDGVEKDSRIAGRRGIIHGDGDGGAEKSAWNWRSERAGGVEITRVFVLRANTL